MSEAGEAFPGLCPDAKYRDVPSHEIAGPPSANGALISLPRFTGSDHGCAVVARLETQMSI
jgi:hypothetical protein